MVTKIKNILLITLVIFGMVATLSSSSDAATGDIYFSPSSPTIEDGSSVTVELRIDPGTAVDGVQATITYNPSLLSETSVNLSNSAFPTTLQNSDSAGSIQLAVGTLSSGGVSTDSLVANISFTALASSGSAALTLSNANATYSGSYTDPAATDGSINLIPVPAPPTPPTTPPPTTPAKTKATVTKTPTSTGVSTPTSTTSSATSTPTVAPTVISPPPKVVVSLSSVEFSGASLVVTASSPISSAITFGTSQTNLSQTTPYSATGTKDTLSLDNLNLTPGTTYYYKVLTADSSGQIVTSALHSFTTKGYTLDVTVLDNKFHPVTNQTITLHSTPVTATTNSQGIAEFTNVAPGVHTLIYDLSKSDTYQKQIYVANNVITKNGIQLADAQSLALVLPIKVTKTNNLLETILIAAIIFVVILMLIETYILIIRYPKMENLHNKYVVSLYLKFRNIGFVPKTLKRDTTPVTVKASAPIKPPKAPKILMKNTSKASK